MKKIKNNQLGFSAVEAILILVFVVILGGIGWYVWSHNKSDTKQQAKQSTTATASKTSESQQVTAKEYKMPNEGLVFSYNPKNSTVETKKPNTSNGLYVEYVDIKTGSATLSIIAGISGIGGGPGCENGDRSTCEVLDTKKSSFLGKSITYRLIKARQVEECGYQGAPPCDTAPLTTSYLLDTGTETDVFGVCCGMISRDAKNVGKKAKNTGTLLISIVPANAIKNEELLTNKDVLESIKIIESMHY